MVSFRKDAKHISSSEQCRDPKRLHSEAKAFLLPGSSGFQSLKLQGEKRREKSPPRHQSRATEDAFLVLFFRNNQLCKGIMLQLEEKKKRNSVSLTAPFREIRR